MDDRVVSPGSKIYTFITNGEANDLANIQAEHRSFANIKPFNTSAHSSVQNEPVPHNPCDSCHPSLEGNSSCIRRIRHLIEKVAATGASVLLLGESGSGKEIAARQVHELSPRRDKPFVPINCGAIPAELLESELFGHEKGAFTGAINSRPGRFEMAEGGTLFLDEVGDMSLDMQVKLLRVLQEKTFERVGSNRPRKADVRIIAATHRNLEKCILENSFREDLYYRLNVFPIEMPPLRRRRDDIPALLISLVSKLGGRDGVYFTDAAVEALQRYDWPGNIRELANLVERLCILHPGETIGIGQLPDKILRAQSGSAAAAVENPVESPDSGIASQFPGVSPADLVARLQIPAEGIDLKDLLTRVEWHFIHRALEASDGVVAQAAKLLNMGRTTLVEKLRKREASRAA